MQLIPYDLSLAEPLTQAYNAAVATVPHCYPVSPAIFHSTLTQPQDRLKSQHIQVATDGDTIRGFIHYGHQPASTDYPPRGIIRFLWYEPGHRKIGKALLDTAEASFRQAGLSRINVLPQNYRYPFYGFNHCYLSDRLGHIAALLGFNGYKKTDGEVFLDAINYQPVEPHPIDLVFDLALEWQDGPGKHPELTVQARQGDQDIGQCKSISCAHFAAIPQLEDWHFCDWLGVKDEFQGHGLGRHLLERTCFEMHKIGYRHAGISTAWENYRAFQLYSNYGYSVVDWTYQWGKDLEGSP